MDYLAEKWSPKPRQVSTPWKSKELKLKVVLDQDTRVTITVGATEYLVDVKKIPYFASFSKFQRLASRDAIHDDVPFFAIINHSVENGYRHFFRRLPHNLSDYHQLCETLEFLAVDVLEGQMLSDVVGDLKKGKDDWDPQERRRIRGLKGFARDAAFRLLYLFMLGDFQSDIRDSNIAFNAVQFIVSHRRTFKYGTRKMVREAFEERFSVSEKQRKGLEKWPIDEPQVQWPEEDVTTEDEADVDFDSFSD